MCVCVENSSFLAVAKQVYVHMWCSVGLPQWNGVYTNCKRTWMGFTHAYNSMVLFEVTRWALMYWSKHSGTQTCCSSPVWCIIHPLQPWSSSAWNNNFPSSNPTQIESFLYVLYLYICENDMTLFMPSMYGVCVVFLSRLLSCDSGYEGETCSIREFTYIRLLSHMYHMLWMCQLIHVKFECIVYHTLLNFFVLLQYNAPQFDSVIRSICGMPDSIHSSMCYSFCSCVFGGMWEWKLQWTRRMQVGTVAVCDI